MRKKSIGTNVSWTYLNSIVHFTSMNPQAKFFWTNKWQKKISRNSFHTHQKTGTIVSLESLLSSDSPEIWYQAPPLKLSPLAQWKSTTAFSFYMSYEQIAHLHESNYKKTALFLIFIKKSFNWIFFYYSN